MVMDMFLARAQQCRTCIKTKNIQRIKKMNTEEKIYPWKPIEGLAGKYNLQSVIDDLESFRIFLSRDDDAKKGVIIKFRGTRSYRISDELLSMHLLQVPIEDYEDPIAREEILCWAFFKVINSEYLKWASYQSNGVSDSLNLTHYAIWTEDTTLEILSWVAPQVEFIDLP